MVAVGNSDPQFSQFLSDKISSNGSDMGVRYTQANSPGDSLYHCKRHPL